MKNLLAAAAFALQFLTRVPLPVSIEPQETTARKALIFFPLVGLIIGALLFGIWRLISASGKFNSFTTAIIIVAAEIIITGAFHLDGLADTFDAFLSSGTTTEEKLTIMKDSRIGVMGATALILSILLKTALLSELLELQAAAVLIIYPATGRWAQVAFYVISPYVRLEGIGHLFSKNADIKTLLFATLWLIPSYVVLSFPAVFIFILLIISLCGYRLYVHHQIGGITGDVLGSATVISEIVFLTGVVIFY